MDRNGNRFLYRYILDGPQPIIDKAQKVEVPADWTGDPETVSVALEIINDVIAGAIEVANLPIGFRQVLDNGDRILVTDFENAVVGELKMEGTAIMLVRRVGFGLQ